MFDDTYNGQKYQGGRGRSTTGDEDANSTVTLEDSPPEKTKENTKEKPKEKSNTNEQQLTKSQITEQRLKTIEIKFRSVPTPPKKK